jgi:hypothetical protein
MPAFRVSAEVGDGEGKVILTYCLFALATGLATGFTSIRAGYSAPHVLAHTLLGTVYAPLVAAWAMWFAHRSGLRAMRSPAPRLALEAAKDQRLEDEVLRLSIDLAGAKRWRNAAIAEMSGYQIARANIKSGSEVTP